MQQDTPALTFPPQLLDDSLESHGPVADRLNRTNEQRATYLRKLEEQGYFNGLYFRGELERETDGSETAHVVGLDWELFDEGLYEARRRMEKSKVETQLQYLRMVGDMRLRRLDEELFRYQQMENATQAYCHGKLMPILEELYRRREAQMRSGFITQDDFAEVEFKYQRARYNLDMSRGHSKQALPADTFHLLNRVERIDLLPLEELHRFALDNSVDLQIQDLMVRRADFAPTWLDDLSVRLFAENRRNLRRDDDSVIGVRVRVPLETDSGRERLIDIEQDAYRNQKAAIVDRLRQRLQSLADQFYLKRNDLRVQKEEYRLLTRKIRLARKRAEAALPTLPYTPERNLELLSVQRVEKECEALSTRLKIYELLLKLRAVTGVTVNAQLYIELPDSPARRVVPNAHQEASG